MCILYAYTFMVICTNIYYVCKHVDLLISGTLKDTFVQTVKRLEMRGSVQNQRQCNMVKI